MFARGPMVGEIGRSEIPLRVFWDSKEVERCTMKQNADSECVCTEVKCCCCERAGRSDQNIGMSIPLLSKSHTIAIFSEKKEKIILKRGKLDAIKLHKSMGR